MNMSTIYRPQIAFSSEAFLDSLYQNNQNYIISGITFLIQRGHFHHPLDTPEGDPENHILDLPDEQEEILVSPPAGSPAPSEVASEVATAEPVATEPVVAAAEPVPLAIPIEGEGEPPGGPIHPVDELPMDSVDREVTGTIMNRRGKTVVHINTREDSVINIPALKTIIIQVHALEGDKPVGNFQVLGTISVSTSEFERRFFHNGIGSLEFEMRQLPKGRLRIASNTEIDAPPSPVKEEPSFSPNETLTLKKDLVFDSTDKEPSNKTPTTAFNNEKTYKSYIHFNASHGSNDPGYIMHEHGYGSDLNIGVLHLCPSDDRTSNSSLGPDYVTVRGTNENEAMRFYTDGKVEVDGTILANDNIYSRKDVYAYYSDIRLKENIEPIYNALDIVSQWSTFTYTESDKVNELSGGAVGESKHKTEKDGSNSGRTKQVGFSAQDLQRTAPELVDLTLFDKDKEGNSKSGEEYLTANYIRTTPYLAAAIKELKDKVDVQSSLIEAQQELVETLLAKH